MRWTGMHMALTVLTALSAGAAHAIDAARSLHPMVHIPNKPGADESAPGSAPSGRSAAQAQAQGQATGRAASPVPPAGSVDTNTVSGKPFVAVKPRSNCIVSAAAGDLEAQLRSCAGVKAGGK